MNGTDKGQLPIPTIYVTESNRDVRHAFVVETSHRLRAESSDVVALAAHSNRRLTASLKCWSSIPLLVSHRPSALNTR